MCKSLGLGGETSGDIGGRDRKHTHPHIFLLSHITEQKDSARKLPLQRPTPRLCRKRRAGGLDSWVRGRKGLGTRTPPAGAGVRTEGPSLTIFVTDNHLGTAFH